MQVSLKHFLMYPPRRSIPWVLATSPVATDCPPVVVVLVRLIFTQVLTAVVFQFCMRQEMIGCTLTGAKNKAEVDANFGAALTPLPETIWDELEALNLNALWEQGEAQHNQS